MTSSTRSSRRASPVVHAGVSPGLAALYQNDGLGSRAGESVIFTGGGVERGEIDGGFWCCYGAASIVWLWYLGLSCRKRTGACHKTCDRPARLSPGGGRRKICRRVCVD